MPLDQQIVGPLPQLDQGTRDDVDEAPGEFPECGRVTLTRKLSRDARGHLADSTEAAHRVVARTDVRPAEVEDVELAFAPGALGLHVHAFQEVRVALRIEDDHHLVLACSVAPPNVLGHEQFGQAGLADPGRAQHERVSDPFAERQAHIDFVRFDAMQSRQAADRRQRAHWIERDVPGGEPGQLRQRKRRELQPLFQAPRQQVGRRRLDIAAEFGPERLRQTVRVPLFPPESAADEQPLLADRHIAAGHHVARQAADVAPVTQDDHGITQADRAEGEEGQCAAQANRWA